jgi:hypothetical protein
MKTASDTSTGAAPTMVAAAGMVGIAALALVGCGSSVGGGGPGGVGPGGTGANGAISWRDDGVKHTSQFATAARVISSTMDLVELTGGDPTQGIAMAVEMPPPIEPGVYSCGLTGTNIIVSFAYNSAGTYLACTVEIKAIGAVAGTHVSGTFSATLGAAAGGSGTKAITEGTFDVVQTINSI